MKPFEYFIETNEAKKSIVDINLAKSLIKDMQERIGKTDLLDIKVFPKIIFENIYDALRDFCDALLALSGYKSYSHQASISFLAKQGFEVSLIEDLDRFRYIRNGSKYYGLSISIEDAQQIRNFYIVNKLKMEKIIKFKGLR